MTPQQIEAMKLALDLATMHHTDDGYAELRAKVRSASKEALAQPEQEPMACKHEWFRTGAMEPKERRCIKCGTFNTTPPQRKPLTEEFGIQQYVDIGHYSLQVIFKDRPSADRFKAAHGIS